MSYDEEYMRGRDESHINYLLSYPMRCFLKHLASESFQKYKRLGDEFYNTFYRYDKRQKDIVSINQNYYQERPEETIRGKSITGLIEMQRITYFDYEFFATIEEYLDVDLHYIKFDERPDYTQLEFDELYANIFKVDVRLQLRYDRGNTYSLPTLYNEIHDIYVKENSHVSPTYFMTVFDVSLWIAIFIFVWVLLLFVIVYHKVKSKLQNATPTYTTLDLFFHISSLSSENINFTSISLKFSVLFISILFICIAGVYSGFLSAAIAINIHDLPFETIEEMKEKGYTLCAYPMFTNTHLLTEEEFATIFENKDCRVVIVDNYDRGQDVEFEFMQQLCKNPAMTTLVSRHKYITRNYSSHTPCDVIKIPHAYYKSALSYSIGRSFVYKNEMRFFITRMRTSGLIHHLQSTFMMESNITIKADSTEVVDVQYGHTYIIFYTYILCLIVPLIIMFIEIIYYHSRRNLSRN